MSAVDYSLYWATTGCFGWGVDWLEQVEAVIGAGVTVVQLRQKDCPARELYERGQQLHRLTRRLGVPLIINDRVDLMLALDAEGVHVGPNDLPLAQVRLLAGNRIVGCSANTLERLHQAAAQGADYVGVGPVFATATKTDTGPVLGLAGLRHLVAASRLPCVAIGGITAATAAAVRARGAAGICVVSAISAASDPVAATRQLRLGAAEGSGQ